MQRGASLVRFIELQATRRFLWSPVFFGIGISLYFAVHREPEQIVLWAMLVGAGLCVGGAIIIRGLMGVAVMFTAAILLGFGWSGMRARMVAEPVLWQRYYGPVTGEVYHIDQSAAGHRRVWMRDVYLSAKTKAGQVGRARVSMTSTIGHTPQIGDIVMVSAHLSPPPGPAEPGGFDFQKFAWFLGVGAVGYARAPPVLWDRPKNPTWQMVVSDFRFQVADWMAARMPERTAGIAIAITVGLRHKLDDDVTASLRQANLAHLLAISGLHMGLMTALVFAVVRFLLILNMRIALYAPVKQIAAGVALIFGFGYLLLSGQSIATERAFVMASVVFVAIILSRRALTLRALALAAWIVLLLRPEALISPGFQMSFAATLGLICGFDALQRTRLAKMNRVIRWVANAIASAAFAGMATAPFAAAHFNLMPHYGVIANFFAIPIMAFVVMPGALATSILGPLGGGGLGVFVMDFGLNWILQIAQFVSGLDGAVSLIKAPQPGTLALIGGGMCVGLLALGWLRAVGAGLLVCATLWWATTPRPDVLIADTANLAGILGPEGRVLSREKGAGFVANSWLENDGDDVSQAESAKRRSGGDWVRISKALPAGAENCDGPIFVVASWDRMARCDTITLWDLSKSGARAGYLQPNGTLKWKTAREVTGRRLWNDAKIRRARLQ